MTTPPLAAAALLAWALARRVPYPRQRAIAATLTGLLVVNLVEPIVRPIPGATLVLWCAWYAATAWGVVAVLRKDEAPRVGFVPSTLGAALLAHPDSNRSPDPEQVRGGVTLSRPTASHCRDIERATPILLVLAILASAAVAVRLGVVAALERGAFALALCVQIVAGLRFVSRSKAPDDAQAVALILAASSVADLAGPWCYGDPTRDWGVGQIQAFVTWLMIAGWEVRCLIHARRSRT